MKKRTEGTYRLTTTELVEVVKIRKEETSPWTVAHARQKDKGQGRAGPDKSRGNKGPRPEKLGWAHGGFEVNKGAACKRTLKRQKEGVTVLGTATLHTQGFEAVTDPRTLLSQWGWTDAGGGEPHDPQSTMQILPIFQENLIIHKTCTSRGQKWCYI